MGAEEEDEHDPLGECYTCHRPMPAPEAGSSLAPKWHLDPDGDVVYCPEHIPGPPPGWRDWAITDTKAEMKDVRVDPVKVPEKYRHLFE